MFYTCSAPVETSTDDAAAVVVDVHATGNGVVSEVRNPFTSWHILLLCSVVHFPDTLCFLFGFILTFMALHVSLCFWAFSPKAKLQARMWRATATVMMTTMMSELPLVTSKLERRNTRRFFLEYF